MENGEMPKPCIFSYSLVSKAKVASTSLEEFLFPGSLMKILGNSTSKFSVVFYFLSFSLILTEVFGQRINNKTLCRYNEGLIWLQVLSIHII